MICRIIDFTGKGQRRESLDWSTRFWLLCLAFLFGGQVSQLPAYQSDIRPSFDALAVDTKYGKMIFRGVTLWDQAKRLPFFSASIENLTGTTWHVAEFTFRCGAEKNASYTIIVPTIVPGSSSFKEATPSMRSCVPTDPNMVSLVLTGGYSDRDREDQREAERQAKDQVARQEAEIEQKRIAAQRVADQKARAKRAADEKAAQEYLAKFPVLNSGASSLLVGADRKCSEQIGQALSMEGLERRKRLADLVAYGCGFVEDSGAHVQRLQAEGSYCQVRLVNGKHANETGWVPCPWIK